MRIQSAIKVLRIIFVLLLVGGCKEDEPQTPNDITEELLKAQVWELTETKIDGVVSDIYDGLTLSFGTKTYSTTNGGKIWPASGTWEFVGDKGDKILRDDGLAITIEKVDASQLVMTFTWNTTTLDGGRMASLKGLHRMVFKRKN
jgi:hypothetical protein